MAFLGPNSHPCCPHDFGPTFSPSKTAPSPRGFVTEVFLCLIFSFPTPRRGRRAGFPRYKSGTDGSYPTFPSFLLWPSPPPSPGAKWQRGCRKRETGKSKLLSLLHRNECSLCRISAQVRVLWGQLQLFFHPRSCPGLFSLHPRLLLLFFLFFGVKDILIHIDKQLKGSTFYNSSSCSFRILLHQQEWQEKVYPRVWAKASESDLARC